VSAASQSRELIVDIAPSAGLRAIDWRELVAYRELLYFLVWRDIKVRYKQTALGAAWAVLQPVLTMVVFSLFLGRWAKVPSDGIPYPLFSFVALVPWTCFATAVTSASASVVSSQQLISKVYFPRLLIPLAASVAPLVDFAFSMLTLVALLVWYHVTPTVGALWLPALVAFGIVSAFAVSLWLSTLTVRYRDVRYVVPFLMQFWLFASPVAYPASIVPARWRLLYGLNPMTAVVEGFRWALAGGPAPGAIAWVSAAAVVLLLAGGLVYFRSAEGTFADTI
jgi:lipopolysaccharide transport system permease protein